MSCQGFKPCKQPLAKMQGKTAYNRPLWSGPFPNLAHSGSFSAPGSPFYFPLIKEKNFVHKIRKLENSKLTLNHKNIIQKFLDLPTLIPKHSLSRKIFSRKIWNILPSCQIYTLKGEKDLQKKSCNVQVLVSLHNKKQ